MAERLAQESIASILCVYTHTYGPQIVLLTLLSAITIYRREMSCNHVYSSTADQDTTQQQQQQQQQRRRSQRSRATSTMSLQQQQQECEDLLDKAATWGSGGPLLAVVLTLWSLIVDETTKSGKETSGTNATVPTRPMTMEDMERALEGVSEWGSGEPILRALLQAWQQHQSEVGTTTTTTCRDGDYSNYCCGGDDDDDLARTSNKYDDTEQLLEGAAHYCSGRALWALFHVFSGMPMYSQPHQQQQQQDRQNEMHNRQRRIQTATTPSLYSSPYPHSLFTHSLSADVQVNTLSFLHPSDVTTLACVNKACRALIDGNTNNGRNNSVSRAVWKTLWERDYGWLIQEWKIGRVARDRSQNRSTPYSKQFYFEFAETYQNYVLAGQNSFDQALVGLHGNLYDITNFLNQHPGTPETLLMEAGRDATEYFEDIGHSTVARKKSIPFCVAVDLLCHEGLCGVQRFGPVDKPVDSPLASYAWPPMQRGWKRRPALLESVRTSLAGRRDTFLQQRIHQRHKQRALGADIVPYYDAWDRQWKAWYTDPHTFEPVFYSETT